ncbi:MAG TPA: hemolysin III family protein [Helicobacteraceae bacterium]|nr:hemolysin III family protein [Helicobacteraceae bacterium]
MSNSVNEFSLAEEIWHAITHGLGLVLSIIGLTVLVAYATLAHSPLSIISAAIFGTTLIIMYGSSTLYHAITHTKVKRIFQQFDHASIYFLIAGSYTPITLITLGGIWGWSIFSVIWLSAIIGIVLKFVYPGRFEKLSLALYLIMGWMIVIAISPLMETMPSGGLWLLLAGGLCYTGGVVFYIWDRLPYNHAIWHLFVLGGSIFHYFMTLLYII